MSALPHAPPPGAVLEAALYADDLKAAARFYGGVMGLEEIIRVAGRHVFFRVGPTVLLIFDPVATTAGGSNPALPVPPHGAHGPGHLCFAATRDEINLWRTRLEAAGYPVEADFDWPNGARSIYFRDPAGNSLEIAEPRLWG
ncbi:glyoxalase/bleomycin resistance/extradiol dioxygenase family protein [Roseovarius sp. TE539]|uniref:VOC family protein n=1 Tax=Roseovarius sp. TE539 TaxID=2249812 RepID=UPI000DDC8F9C|nr:VOC family protein [Roseovarius sp. TE539]RBI77297.1 glyoxalase/bleomycin resistance/extradiol dioxygenase family protein [Roseovarius sp. TE539]